MSIDTLALDQPQRKRIAWLGQAPRHGGEEEKVFISRGFVVDTYSTLQLKTPSDLASLAAIVFTQQENDLQAISRELAEADAGQLLDYDCIIIIRAFDDPKYHTLPLRIIANAAKELRLWMGGPLSRQIRNRPVNSDDPPLPHVQIYGLNTEWSTIANFISEHQPGPPPSPNLIINRENPERPLTRSTEILLRRAFWDCSKLHLKPIPGGRSGVPVYLAHAELIGGDLGAWPLPYFIKIGDRKKILKEYMNYIEKVDSYIPFHLCPHIIPDRCCLGANEGVIVGDFVEESESLIDCASSGRAGPAIACLFDRTLAGWHRSAAKDQEETCRISTWSKSIMPRMSTALANRIEHARRLGATKTLAELQNLIDCCDSLPVLTGPIHGDLHAANVQVRATDAIVIDFLAHTRGPLIFDAASLEASLLVEGFSDKKEFSRASMSMTDVAQLDSYIKAWIASIEALYDHIPLQDLLRHPEPHNDSYWFHACVRQIRRFAQEMEVGPHQYATALAIALLRKACKDTGASEPEASRRAVAYLMAERVLVHTFQAYSRDYCI